MSPDTYKARALIAGYRAATGLLQPLLPVILKRRLARGKEDPARWREKIGQTSSARPAGRLIWLHAVGLGETLALRGAIAALHTRLPDAHFLVTSTTRASAQVFTQNLPARTIHQFLPLDTPKHVRAFMDHWRPDLSVWAEQELWPGFVLEAAKRGIPLALINARITKTGLAQRQRVGPLYHALLQRFALISAQDETSANHLRALGADDVSVSGLLKSTAPPLAFDADKLASLQAEFGDRFIWVAASSHPEDEVIARAAHAVILKDNPDALLAIIPRHPERADQIAAGKGVRVIAAFGALGIWYRLANAAYIGGTNSAIEGHNPWEAAALGCPVFHGPRFGNFTSDFPALQAAGGAKQVDDPEALAALLQDDALPAQGKSALAAVATQKDTLASLFDDLASLVA